MDETEQTPAKTDDKSSLGIQLPEIKMDALGDSLASEMPEVQTASIEKMLKSPTNRKPEDKPAKKIPTARKGKEFTDKNGIPYLDKNGDRFDPERHKHINGKPDIAKTGLLKLKPGKPRPGSKIEDPHDQQVEAERTKTEYEESMETAGELADFTTDSLFEAGTMIGGPEWAPIKTPEFDERNRMNKAFKRYYFQQGTEAPPPWMMLAYTVTSYAAIRFTQPITLSRITKVKLWIAGKLQSRKAKKIAQFNTRNDTKRKNDTGNKDERSVSREGD